MLLLSFLRHPAEVIAFLSVLIVGLTFHECAHAWTAFRLGDATAYYQGRLTLDPRAHLDPVGALMFLIVGFGWAKPVPVDGYRLGRRGTLWVSLAGPVSNILLAAIALVPLRLVDPQTSPLYAPLAIFGVFNLFLAAFNLVPLAPLDGWKVLLGLVPAGSYWQLRQYEQYGPFILLLLVFAGRLLPVSPLLAFVQPVADGLYRVLAGHPPPF